MSNQVNLYRLASSMTPLLPENDVSLRILVAELLKKSGRLTGVFNPITREAIASLIEPMNSYYSNLIEGHNTHPLDIDKALKKEYSTEPQKKILQLESLAHVRVNKLMKEHLKTIESVYHPDFIQWIHKTFYDFVPDDFCFVKDISGNQLKVAPGLFRKTEVTVGKHIAPASEVIADFMSFFSSGYDKFKDPMQQVIAIAASHHRLAWIHPFLDGNGRALRLFSEACFIKQGIDGAGLWSISRGLAVHNEKYYTSLHNADQQRWNDHDGRGNLSEKQLVAFCEFFLETAIDQVEFMLTLLEPEKIANRIKEFVNLMVASGELRPESVYVLLEALYHGKVLRGEMQRLTGKSENIARSIMKDLLDKELLISETTELRSPVRINFPIRYAPYIFPKLFPKDVEASMKDY